MMVKLLQALHIGGKLYPLGVQDIPEEKLKHPHFSRAMNLGQVIEADAPVAEVVLESAAQRGKRLADKLYGAKKKLEAPVDESSDLGESSDEANEVSDDSEQKDSSKKKSKHRR